MINSENERFFSESFPFWKELSSSEKKLVKNNTELKLYKAGSTIHDSTECTGVLLIKTGELRVYILSPEGREVTLYRLGTGETYYLRTGQEMPMEMADLNAVLGEVIAAESGYEREIETALYPGSIEVKMHPLSIKRAVANMVVNAARYGNGWIKVSSGTEPNRAWFQVEDDGPGIAPEQRKHLFQPFVRGDSARTISGTGLGLAIVQRIVDNHNGMLELGTSERGGLSIRAWLPVPVTRAQGTTKEG